MVQKLTAISNVHSYCVIEIGLRHFGDAVSAMGRSGDRRFGDRMFWRPPVRRLDVSVTGRFGDGRFGDQPSTVYVSKQTMLKLKRQKVNLFVSLATLGQKGNLAGELLVK